MRITRHGQLGSLGGCVLRITIARKAGEAMFHKHAGLGEQDPGVDQAQCFAAVIGTALLPSAEPFKVL